MLMMSALGAGRSSPQCCENCMCPESCPGCPSYTGRRGRFAVRSMARGGAMRGLGSVTTTITAHPWLFALGLATTAVLAYTVTHKSTRRR